MTHAQHTLSRASQKQAQQHQQPKRRGKQSKRPAAAAVKLEEPVDVKSEVKLEHADDGGPFPYFSRPTQQVRRRQSSSCARVRPDPSNAMSRDRRADAAINIVRVRRNAET